MAEAYFLWLVALDSQAPGVLEDRAPADDVDALALGDGGKAARQPSHHTIALPGAQRVERQPWLTEFDTEFPRALGFADDRGHVQECFGRDTALVQTRAPEPRVRVHDD